MEIAQFIVFIIAVFIIYFAGAVHGFVIHQRMVNRRIRQVIGNMAGDIVKDVIHITIEKHNDTIYVYDKNDKKFMAQGKSRDEVERVLAEKYPGKKFAAADNEIKTGFAE